MVMRYHLVPLRLLTYAAVGRTVTCAASAISLVNAVHPSSVVSDERTALHSAAITHNTEGNKGSRKLDTFGENVSKELLV